jgi:hypothetical protein
LKTTTTTHAFFSLYFPILFYQTWEVSLYMPWGFGPVISLFMPFPLAKANIDMVACNRVTLSDLPPFL